MKISKGVNDVYKGLAIGLLLSCVANAKADFPAYSMVSEGIIQTAGIRATLQSVTKAGNGDVVVMFNTISDQFPGSKAHTIRSTNAGFSWDSPVLALDTINQAEPLESVHTNVGLTTLANGTMLAPMAIGSLKADPVNGWPGLKYTHAYVSRSIDNGVTWSTPSYVTAGPVLSSPFGHIVEHADGSLIMPIITNPGWGEIPVPLDQWEDGYVTSYDGGITWPVYTRMDRFGETSILRLQDGTYIAMEKAGRTVVSSDGVNWNLVNNRVGGKNASLITTSKGYTLLLYSVSGGPGLGAYTLDNGSHYYKAFELEPGAYGIDAVVLSPNTILVTYTLSNTLRYKIYREDIMLGVPMNTAIGEDIVTPSINPVNTVPKPYAYPCPWRSDIHSGRPIRFSHLPINSSVKIFTISAQLVTTVFNDSWDMTNSHGERVASGIYIFLVTNGDGFKSTGKLVVIK